MIRIAAVGDIHYDSKSSGRLSTHFSTLEKEADLFLLAGDLTQLGKPEEMECLAKDLRMCPVPTIAVFGNHDYHSGHTLELTQILREADVQILNGSSVQFKIRGLELGIAGIKGFGGGFVGACCTAFGEQEMKDFALKAKSDAELVQKELLDLDSDLKIALFHYSPIPETLEGEPLEIYPFLGSYHLAEAVDLGGANICFHGHAHRGCEKGETPGGVPVRNVAQPVIDRAFGIYYLDTEWNLQKNRVKA